jgi:hypothetical protein
MLAENDPVLREWIWGIQNGKPTRAGGFLRSVAFTALRADEENYSILRPALLKIREKYPKYRDTELGEMKSSSDAEPDK